MELCQNETRKHIPGSQKLKCRQAKTGKTERQSETRQRSWERKLITAAIQQRLRTVCSVVWSWLIKSVCADCGFFPAIKRRLAGEAETN